MVEDEKQSESGYEKFMRLVKEEMLKSYSEKVVDYALDPRNMGPMPNADGHAKVTGRCGDTMEIFLKIKDGKVIDASFLTDGCGSTVACGCAATDLVKGKKVSEAKEVNSEAILKFLGGLPEPSVHCSLLAARTLKTAVEDFLKNAE